MEYTKDVIFNVKYTKKTNFFSSKFERLGKLKIWRILRKSKIIKFFRILRTLIHKDQYFTLTMIISVLLLGIDYLIVKRFIEIVNLL